jgi:hypothetical protein
MISSVKYSSQKAAQFTNYYGYEVDVLSSVFCVLSRELIIQQVKLLYKNKKI